jgi:hypothetical protein
MRIASEVSDLMFRERNLKQTLESFKQVKMCPSKMYVYFGVVL